MTILIIEYKYLTIEYSQIKIITEVDSSSQRKTFYAAEKIKLKQTTEQLWRLHSTGNLTRISSILKIITFTEVLLL
jgi:hypothetical protein